MKEPVRLKTPLSTEDLERLNVGDRVLISGKLYTARDAAHRRLCAAIEAGGRLPMEIRGQVIYYCGPTPAKPGKVTGSAGPTTSYRMDSYAPILIGLGLKGMIGKGKRSPQVREAIKKFKAVYFGATGGAGALLAKRIKSARVIAYEDLGPEAVRELIVEDFPAVVINDTKGNDLYEQALNNRGKRSPSGS